MEEKGQPIDQLN